MQICKDNRFLPESFFQKYKSADSLLSDSIQNCGAIMDIMRESPLPEPEPIRSGIVSAIFGKSASVPAVPVNLNCETTPELLREHPAREWQELCRKFPQTNVPLAVKEFPWLRRVNSRRFSIHDYRNRFRKFLEKMHPSTFIDHWGREPKAYMKIMNRYLDKVLDPDPGRRASLRELEIMDSWYVPFVRDLKFIQLKSFFLENTAECNEFIVRENPDVSPSERKRLKDKFLFYLMMHDLPGVVPADGSGEPAGISGKHSGTHSGIHPGNHPDKAGMSLLNSYSLRADWIMAYNQLLISEIVHEPGLEGVLINLILSKIPAARNAFLLLPFPLWFFLDDPRLLRLFTDDPTAVIADMMPAFRITFPMYREQTIINLRMLMNGQSLTASSSVMQEYMALHGVPRSGITNLIFASLTEKARQNLIKNRAVRFTAKVSSEPGLEISREHALSDSFIENATSAEARCYQLIIHLFDKIINDGNCGVRYLAENPADIRAGNNFRASDADPALSFQVLQKLGLWGFPLSLQRINPRYRSNIDKNAHHNLPYAAMIFTSTMMAKTASLIWVMKALTGKHITTRDNEMVKSVVNRSLAVLTRYLNDPEFWPEPHAGKAEPRKNGGKSGAKASGKGAKNTGRKSTEKCAGGSSGKAGRKNAVKGAGTAKVEQKCSVKTARKKQSGESLKVENS